MVMLVGVEARELAKSRLIDEPVSPIPCRGSTHAAVPMRKYASTLEVGQARDLEAGASASSKAAAAGSMAVQRRSLLRRLGRAVRGGQPPLAPASPTAHGASSTGPAVATGDAPPPAGPRRLALCRAFVSAPDVYAVSQQGGIAPAQPLAPPGHWGSQPPGATPEHSVLGDAESGEVVMLYSKDEALGEWLGPRSCG